MNVSKRLFDIMFSAAGLILLSPVMALAALLVKLEDGGPVFFLHERMGMGFRPFRMIKFRTMVVDAPDKGLAITVGGDKRVTKVGRLLRKSKLDETPQFINVLKGEMSMVGPRPEVRKYVEAARDDYEEILKVPPGITDYASIMFRDEEEVLAGAADPEALYLSEVLPRKIRLNKEYIRDAGLVEDVRIIIKTLLTL